MDYQLIAAALRAAADVLEKAPMTQYAGGPAPQLAPVQQPAPYTPSVSQPVAQQAPVQQPASNVTAEAITALIQPHVGNEAIKGALGAAMRAMGINALPETQPHQFGALYQAFQNVIAQHTQPVQQAPAGNGLSII